MNLLKKTKADDYAKIAPFYSRLATLVFGNVLKEAGLFFLEISPNSSVVIIGGGDGSAYANVAENLSGEFWEKSAAMLKLAQKQLSKSNLSFHLGWFRSTDKADFILLPFVLDTFSNGELEKLLMQLKANLSPGGRVLVSDFFPPSGVFHRMVLWGMIGFFRAVTSHSRKDLPDYDFYFQQAGYRKVSEKCWKKGWIRAQEWRLI